MDAVSMIRRCAINQDAVAHRQDLEAARAGLLDAAREWVELLGWAVESAGNPRVFAPCDGQVTTQHILIEMPLVAVRT